MYALELRNVTKRFPGLVANDRITLDIRSGEIHAIVGENGAGKSTLMHMITGLYRPDAGEILVAGEKVQFSGPRDAIDHGIGMVHQHFMLIDRFNVVENVILGFEKSPNGLIDFTGAQTAVAELCQAYEFKLDLTLPVEELSVGHKQRVEILKVLYRGAKLLILDEPTAVLTPQETKELFNNLRKLRAEGKTILFISHKLDEVLSLSDRITVLRRGKVVATVDAAATDQEHLAEAMVGRPVARCTDKAPAKPGEAVLTVTDLTLSNDGCPILDRLAFSVAAGEIYGIAGVEGNGQRELVEAIMGLRPYQAGAIAIKGQPAKNRSVAAIRELGVGYIPEDRHHRGVILPFSVWENMVLGNVRRQRFSSWRKLMLDRIRDFAAAKIQEFDIRSSSMELPIRTLSGGNQQKVILARELSSGPELVIAAQPVRGLDIGAIEFVRQKLLEARDNGKAVLLISADLEEVLSLSDRVGIMYEGKIVREFTPGELTAEAISQYMLGCRKVV